jgi:hypothetical protein
VISGANFGCGCGRGHENGRGPLSAGSGHSRRWGLVGPRGRGDYLAAMLGRGVKLTGKVREPKVDRRRR